MNLKMGLLGRKVGMTQIYDDGGRAVPVTAIEAGPCTVIQVRSEERDGYASIQLGFLDRPARDVSDELRKRAQGRRAEYDLEYGRVGQPLRGHFFKAGSAPKYFVREIRLGAPEASAFQPGQQVGVDVFSAGDFVDVVGVSKGRGFTGVIKRHGFTKFGNSHGTHQWRRHAGSIGCRKPQHTRRGTRMAGQLGNTRTTVQNLKVAAVSQERNLLLVRGAVPGPNGGFVVVRKALKK
ncbi:MAG: 50S ribosomal protein L3 [Planctomycetota bacterium]